MIPNLSGRVASVYLNGWQLILKIAYLTSSVSRNAGGILDCVRRPAQVVQEKYAAQVEVLSLWDEATAEDQDLWSPLRPKVFQPRYNPAFGYAPELLNELLNLNADVLHSHGLWMYPSLASAKWHRKTRRPYIVSPHGMLDHWALKNSHWKKRLAGYWFENSHLQQAACLQALCNSEAAAIRGYGLRNPICVIPNGIDIPTEVITADPPWSDRVDPEQKILLYLGRLHPKKGLSNLLQAWRIICDEQNQAPRKWVLVIAGWGQGEHESELKLLSREMQANGKVYFIGPQFGALKNAAFSHANAFILPSFSEGLPVVVLEAWAYRLPVIKTAACNLPEGFETKAALQVEPKVEDIVRGLHRLFAMSDEECDAMGRRGRQLVEQRFSWPSIADDLFAVYQWVIGRGPQPHTVVTS